MIFDLPPPQGPGYLAAIGLRDLAFGLYILVLALCATGGPSDWSRP